MLALVSSFFIYTLSNCLLSLLHTLQRWSSVWLLFRLVCGFHNFFFFNECYLLKIWRYHMRIKVSTCSWKFHLFNFRFTFPMTPCWSRKANALVDKVCKLTLTRSPSLPFDLFSYFLVSQISELFHLQVSLLVKMNFFKKNYPYDLIPVLMEISMVIYFYHNLPHNNPIPSRKCTIK